MNRCSPTIPFDIFHSVIIPEVILDYIHSVLVTGQDSQWNAFVVLPLVCADFNRSCRTFNRMIFGFRDGDYSSEMIQNVYHPAKDSWLRARGLIKDSEDGLIVRYRDLMANENLIQIYVCLAYARRFLNQDVLSPLFYRGRSTLLPDGLKPVELLLGSKTSDDDETDFQSYQVMQDDRMHRLFMPLTCAIKLCDTVPPRLAQHVARYIANIGPYCATIPVLLKYTQDLQNYLNQTYPVSQEVRAGWVVLSLNLISQVDSFLQRFQRSGGIVSSLAKFDTVPRHFYEIVDLPAILEQVAQYDWADGSSEIHVAAHAIITKLNNHY